jgi:pyruvate/2-oxoglutarate/acetoin dehydrogenase E1 component
MAGTVAETIRHLTRKHLEDKKGLLFGQCVTAVGWIGGTIPEMTEEEGIVELSMADVAGPGIAVGAAVVGRRPIYVIRYQGFMWYNAAPLLNYAAKSKEMWGVPCPLLVRAIAMEGGIGPVASGSHHGMVMRMPGMPVCAPMTPREWTEAWDWFMDHDDPLYVSEHRKSFPIDYEMEPAFNEGPQITILAISAARLNALEAVKLLAAKGITCDVMHLNWLKPFRATDSMLQSLAKSKLGLVIDSDFEISGPARSIAYELMLASSVPVHALGVEDRTAGFAPHLDNGTPTVDRIVHKVKILLQGEPKCKGKLSANQMGGV